MKAYAIKVEQVENGVTVDLTSNDGRIYRYVFSSYALAREFIATDVDLEPQRRVS